LRFQSIGRREFIIVLGGVAVSPLAGHAQQPERMRRLGVLNAWPEKDQAVQAIVATFAQALGRLGWVEGKNIRIDYRFAAGDPALFRTHAAELVGLSPDVIFATSAPSVAALQQQTRTIPIVFAFVPDPVGLGLFRALRGPAATSRGSASSTRR
jgi:putative ABC transport system substrate-binding protein